MKEETKKKLVSMARSQLGGAEDNLYRAQRSFNGMTAEQLAMQHGESGRTRQSILDAYAADVESWRDVLTDLGVEPVACTTPAFQKEF